MKIYSTISILIFSILVFSCKKDNEINSEFIPGNYKGTFTVNYNGQKQTSKNIEVIFQNDNKYSSTGKTNPRIPAGGSGNYTVTNNIIQFSDKNPWTAEFDWNLILSGNYQYTFRSNKLTLKKIIKSDNATNIYEYNLTKQ